MFYRHCDPVDKIPKTDEIQNIENPTCVDDGDFVVLNVTKKLDSDDPNDCNPVTNSCEVKQIPEGCPIVDDVPQAINIDEDTPGEIIPTPDDDKPGVMSSRE